MYKLQVQGLGGAREPSRMGICARDADCGPGRTCVGGRCVSGAQLRQLRELLRQSLARRVLHLRGQAEQTYRDVTRGAQPDPELPPEPVLRLFESVQTDLRDIAHLVRAEKIPVEVAETQEHVRTLAASAAALYRGAEARREALRQRARDKQRFRIRALGFQEVCHGGGTRLVYDGAGRVIYVAIPRVCNLSFVGAPGTLSPELKRRQAEAIAEQLGRQLVYTPVRTGPQGDFED